MRLGAFFVIFSSCFFYQTTAVAQEKIGVVLATKGEVVAVRDGTERTLQRRSEIFVKDVLSVKKNAMVQLRFADDSLLTIKSEGVLSLDQFSNRGTSEDAFQATLSQGSLRTRTGGISKGNPRNYGIKTPVGVMGVRGTLFSAAYENDSQRLKASFFRKSGFLSNDFGVLDLGEGARFNFGELAFGQSPIGSLQDSVIFDDESFFDVGADADGEPSESSGEGDDLSEESDGFWDDFADIELLSDEEFEDLMFELDNDFDFEDFDFDDFENLLDDFVDDGWYYEYE